jgi:hypothetical protein
MGAMSIANLGLLGAAAWYPEDHREAEVSTFRRRAGIITLLLGLCSQVLYLVFVLIWLFGWMPFYPGNPVEGIATSAGLLLSTAGCVVAALGIGLRRCVGLASGVMTGFLWLLAAAASVAV